MFCLNALFDSNKEKLIFFYPFGTWTEFLKASSKCSSSRVIFGSVCNLKCNTMKLYWLSFLILLAITCIQLARLEAAGEDLVRLEMLKLCPKREFWVPV